VTKTVPVRFSTGFGSHPDANPILDVAYHAEYLRGGDQYGTCAFCKGDPCNEGGDPDSTIAKFFAHAKTRGRTVSVCPCCEGRPT